MKTVTEIQKKLGDARKEIEKSTQFILSYEDERNKRADEIVDSLGSVVSDKRINVLSNKIRKEQERKEKLQLAISPLQKKLDKSIAQLWEKAVSHLEEEVDRTSRGHMKLYSEWKDKNLKLKELGREVDKLYQEKKSLTVGLSRCRNSLTPEKVKDLVFHVNFIIEKDHTLRDTLLRKFPDFANIISPEISKAIEARDTEKAKELEEARRKRKAEDERARAVMNLAKKWVQNKWYPKELFGTQDELSPQLLVSFWRKNNIDPFNDYTKDLQLKDRSTALQHHKLKEMSN